MVVRTEWVKWLSVQKGLRGYHGKRYLLTVGAKGTNCISCQKTPSGCQADGACSFQGKRDQLAVNAERGIKCSREKGQTVWSC